MHDRSNQLPQKALARMAGLFYLAYIVVFAVSTIFQSRNIAWSDAAATGRAITASPGIFRLGVTLELIAALLFLLTAWALYVVFKHIDGNLALLFLLLNAVGVAIECVNALLHFAALVFCNGTDYLTAFKSDQLHALALLSLKVSASGSMVTVLFYSAWLFPLGYLVIRSRLLPKVFGILLLLDGASLAICFVQLWFFPGYERWTYPLFPVMFVAECGFGIWLAVKGTKEPASDLARQ
jgi:hypothetical protein